MDTKIDVIVDVETEKLEEMISLLTQVKNLKNEIFGEQRNVVDSIDKVPGQKCVDH